MRKSTEPFIGEKTTFANKYAQIKSIRIEYEQMESRLPKDGRKGTLTETNIAPKLPCKWHCCREGNFMIEESIISRMVAERSTDLAGTLHCVGHEKIRSQRGSDCPNYLTYKATITYNDVQSNSGQA